jgi:uncharacterized protein
MPKEGLTNYLKRWLRSIEHHRWFGPWRHHFANRALWRFSRRSVSRGVAVGLFFGVMTPVAQIIFATVFAIVLRANLIVAAGCTLVTNPFTFPFIYYGAFRIGVFLLGPSREIVEDLSVSEEAASRALEVDSWFSTLTNWFSEVGYPLLVGVTTLALTLSLIGYLLVYGAWNLIQRRRRARGRPRAPRRSKAIEKRSEAIEDHP